jgi:hypothetical protein
MHSPRSHMSGFTAHVAATAARLRSVAGSLRGRRMPTAAGRNTTVRSNARVPTARSARYAKQLCSHAVWKTPRAQWTPPNGVIEFPGGLGTCRITAEPDCLVLAVEAADPATSRGCSRSSAVTSSDSPPARASPWSGSQTEPAPRRRLPGAPTPFIEQAPVDSQGRTVADRIFTVRPRTPALSCGGGRPEPGDVPGDGVHVLACVPLQRAHEGVPGAPTLRTAQWRRRCRSTRRVAAARA